MSRHRKPLDEDEDREWSKMTRCGFSFFLFVAILLLWSAFGLALYWANWLPRPNVGFGWTENARKMFNYHPVLMIGGMVTLSGHALLTYRCCGCMKRVFSKLIHTFFHLGTIACAAIGVIAAFGSHDYADPPIKNLYSLHSWLGLITLGLFALQFVAGFFSFLLLLCCASRTAAFRASMVPLHATFGLITFMLAIATALTGITERAIFNLGDKYQDILDVDLDEDASLEGLVLNTLGLVLVALAIIVPLAIHRDQSRTNTSATVYMANSRL